MIVGRLSKKKIDYLPNPSQFVFILKKKEKEETEQNCYLSISIDSSVNFSPKFRKYFLKKAVIEQTKR